MAAYRVKLKGGGWREWVYVSSADLAALAAIFARRPIYLHEDGTITTGPEAIGDD